MVVEPLIVVALVILLFGAISRRAERSALTPHAHQPRVDHREADHDPAETREYRCQIATAGPPERSQFSAPSGRSSRLGVCLADGRTAAI